MNGLTTARRMRAVLLIATVLLTIWRWPAARVGAGSQTPGQTTPCADLACSSPEILVRVFVFIHNNSSASLQLAGSETFDNNILTEPVPASIAPQTNAEFANMSTKSAVPVGGHVHYNVSGGGKLNIDYAIGFVKSASVTPQGANANSPYCSLEFGSVSVGGAAITITFSDNPSSSFDTRGVCVGLAAVSSTPAPTASPQSTGQPFASPTPSATPAATSMP
jgi:hypothetical protein